MEIMTIELEEQERVTRKFAAIRKRVKEKLEKAGCGGFDIDLLNTVLNDASVCKGRVAVATAYDEKEKCCISDGENVVYYVLKQFDNEYFSHVLFIYAYNTVKRREWRRQKFLKWMLECGYPFGEEIFDSVNADLPIKIYAFNRAIEFVCQITPLMSDDGKFIGQEVAFNKNGKFTFILNKPISYLVGNTCFISLTKQYNHDFNYVRTFYPH